MTAQPDEIVTHSALELMDAKNAGIYLGVSGEMLKRYARRGDIPAYRVGRSVKFARRDLDAWVESRSTALIPHHLQQK